MRFALLFFLIYFCCNTVHTNHVTIPRQYSPTDYLCSVSLFRLRLIVQPIYTVLSHYTPCFSYTLYAPILTNTLSRELVGIVFNLHIR